MRSFALATLAVLAALTLPATVPAQGAAGSGQPGAEGKPRVYLDCPNDYCDTNYFVTEVPYVDFIRERADADVHVLVTSLATGSGGRAYTLNFIGLGRRAGRVDTLTANVPPNASEEVRRREIARVMKLGLVPYAMASAAAARLSLAYAAPPVAQGGETVARHDPWNFWVFRVSGNTNFGGESESRRASVSSSVSARRITENLKVSIAGSGSYRETRYTFSDGSESFFALRNYSSSVRVVKSYGQHWSAGLSGGLGSSDFTNQKLSANGLVSAEYNFFPWSQATRQQLVAIYAIGAQHYRYKQETIYFQTEETRPQQQIVIAATSRQPWGSVDVQGTFSQYLHDPSKNNAGIFASVDLRLAKGFSLSFFGSASQVRDQLYIAAAGLTRDQILTQQRARATSYQYSGFVSLSYTFGSLLSNIVNPRLDNLGGGGTTFFFF